MLLWSLRQGLTTLFSLSFARFVPVAAMAVWAATRLPGHSYNPFVFALLATGHGDLHGGMIPVGLLPVKGKPGELLPLSAK